MSMPYVGIELTGEKHHRAKGGSYLPLDKSAGTVVTAKTASYQVLAKDAYKAFSNSGAAGAVTFTMPADAPLGVPYWFHKATAQNVVIAVPAGTLDGAATRTNSAAEANQAWICVMRIGATAFVSTIRTGTWALA